VSEFHSFVESFIM